MSMIGKIIKAQYKLAKKTHSFVYGKTKDFIHSTNVASKKSGYILDGDRIGYDSFALSDYSSLLLPKHLSSEELKFLSNGELALGNFYNPRIPNNRYPFSIHRDQIFRHSILIAPTGSGKTYGVIVPAIHSLLQNNFSVIANDVKGDMLQHLKDYKNQLSTPSSSCVFSFNPFDANSSQSWNPLDEIKDVNDDSLINSIVNAIIGNDDSQGAQNIHFVERDKRWLSSLVKLMKIKKTAPSLNDIYEIICNQNELINLSQAAPKAIKQNLIDLINMNNINMIAGLSNKLRIFNDRNVKNAMTFSSFNIDYIINNPVLLIIGNPLSEGEEAFKITSILYAVLRNKILKHGPLQIPSCWMMDEAGQIAKRLNLKNDLATIRSYNVGIFLSIQQLSQFGENDYKNYLANCSNKIILEGVDYNTAEYFEKSMGNKKVKEVSKIINQNRDKSWNTSTKTEPVLSASNIMSYPETFLAHSGIYYNPNVSKKPILLNFSR